MSVHVPYRMSVLFVNVSRTEPLPTLRSTHACTELLRRPFAALVHGNRAAPVPVLVKMYGGSKNSHVSLSSHPVGFIGDSSEIPT